LAVLVVHPARFEEQLVDLSFSRLGAPRTRVVFGGPVFGDKTSLSEVREYDVICDPVRGLAWSRNEIKKQGFSSYSTLQAILSAKQVVMLNVFPQRTQFANIIALIPQPPLPTTTGKALP
jgi:hypothetical protein